MNQCSTCLGRGWIEVVDHAEECYEKGECVNCGGVRTEEPCPDCDPEGLHAAAGLS